MSTTALAETNGAEESAVKSADPKPLDLTAQNPLASMGGEEFANLMDRPRFNQLWAVAKLFASSKLIPEHFRNAPEDCFIACSMAMRLGIDPLMLMQNTYIVHGKPGMEAKLVIALVNTSGMFDGGIQYEREGGNAKDSTFRVRAYAVRRSNGEVVYGPWVDWATVRAEGWESKAGSKWKTIPDLMFAYRAATWFGRLYCPERLMGMQTADELEDVGDRKPFEPREVKAIDAPKPTNSEKVLAAAARLKQQPETTPVGEAKPQATETDAERLAREDWERLQKEKA